MQPEPQPSTSPDAAAYRQAYLDTQAYRQAFNEAKAGKTRGTGKPSLSLNDFTVQAWKVVEPATPFVSGWHLDAINEHLEAVSKGQIRNLLINMPPRHMKSMAVAVFWPMWEWTFAPGTRWLFASYALSLSKRDSLKCRRLIESQWYRERFGKSFHLTSDQNEKLRFENDRTGYRIATSVGGSGTGEGGNRIVCLWYNTPVCTELGEIPIGEIVSQRLPVQVLGYDHLEGAWTWQDIQAYECGEGRSSVQVAFTDGRSIQMTADHPVYVASRGYVRALELKAGDRVCDESGLRYLWERNRSTSGASSAEHAGRLLQPSVSRQRADRTGESKVGRRAGDCPLPRMQSRGSRQTEPSYDGEVLLSSMSDRWLPLRPASSARAETADRVRLLSSRDAAQALSFERDKFLLEGVCESISSDEDAGHWESAFRAWAIARAVFSGVSQTGTDSEGSRRAAMLQVPNDSSRAWEGTGRSSYRLRQGERYDGQSSLVVSMVPRSDARRFERPAQMDSILVKSVEPLERPDYVYNIRVGTGNYLANGVLVHNCDDPHNATEAQSDSMRESALTWWDETMSTRLNDPQKDAKVIVMQRLHERDLSGHVLEQGGYEHLNLPAEYEPKETISVIGWSDPRTQAGELLWPERFRAQEIAQLKRDLGSYAAAGQLQQRPSPAEGGMLKRFWWRYWKPKGSDFPSVTVRLADGALQNIAAIDLPEPDEQIQSWDMAFKDEKAARSGDPDPVVGQVWNRKGADCFLVDQVRDRLDFPATCQAVKTLTAKWPRATAKLVEDKANGSAVIATLKSEIGGLIAVEPDGGKIARASAVSPTIEAGNVYLPHPMLAPWVSGFIEECAAFPNGAHNDQVDSASQALKRLTHRVKPRPRPQSRAVATYE